MKTLLFKEARLATPTLTYCFLAFSLLTFCPGYPILLSAFFICLGIFQAYQTGITNHDLLYSVLLPIAKREIVISKFIFTGMIELCGFSFITVITIIRMIFLNQTAVFKANALMNANPLFLAFCLLVFTEFNWFFLRQFFKTGYQLLAPFLWFSLAAFATIMLAETVHHLPGLAILNKSTGLLPVQLTSLLIAIIVFFAVTALACKQAENNFEKLDF